MNRFQLVIVLILLVFLGWIATKDNSQKSEEEEQQMVKVGVSQITAHPVFDEINAGIIEGFAAAGYTTENGNIVFDFQNAQNESSVNQIIAEKFSGSDYDLIMSLGTPASQALVNRIKDRPIIFGAVTDPVSAGLVASNEAPGGNVTGTSDITLYKEQLELLKRLVPTTKTIGVVYNPGEANAVFALKETEKFAKELNMTVATVPVNNSSQILSAAQSLVKKVDAFYMLPDSTVISGQGSLIKVALESKKPLISIDQSGVEAGALATLGTNYRMVGVRTAEIALRVLDGENTATIPVLGVTDADVFLNLKTASVIGVSIPEELRSKAKQVYE